MEKKFTTERISSRESVDSPSGAQAKQSYYNDIKIQLIRSNPRNKKPTSTSTTLAPKAIKLAPKIDGEVAPTTPSTSTIASSTSAEISFEKYTSDWKDTQIDILNLTDGTTEKTIRPTAFNISNEIENISPANNSTPSIYSTILPTSSANSTTPKIGSENNGNSLPMKAKAGIGIGLGVSLGVASYTLYNYLNNRRRKTPNYKLTNDQVIFREEGVELINPKIRTTKV